LPDRPNIPDPESALKTEVLLLQAREGSQAAWEVLYRRYRVLLVTAVRMRIPDFIGRRFDAEDVLQSAFVSVLARIRSFEYQGEGSFRRWLKRIVLNRFQDRLRQAQREENNRIAPARDGLGVDLADPRGRSPEEEVELSDFQAHALACMSELDEDDQEVLTLRLFEKASYAQAAEVLELSPPAARKRYHQALDRLMQRIDAGGETRAP
jgi:RNA polymerase sigma-70 factor (ECF subfamily)